MFQLNSFFFIRVHPCSSVAKYFYTRSLTVERHAIKMVCTRAILPLTLATNPATPPVTNRLRLSLRGKFVDDKIRSKKRGASDIRV